MKHILAGCLVGLCIFSSCAQKEPDQDTSLTNTVPAATATAGVADSQIVVTAPVDTATLATPGQAIVAPMPQQQAVNQANAPTAPGMNPAHGQPNHRCDIAVGAPLNSPVAKTTAPAVTQTAAPAVTQTVAPAVTQTNKPAAKTVTAPGMNPPHGEPGHRCDIAVGASLSSPVTKPAIQAVTPVAVPAKKDGGR